MGSRRRHPLNVLYTRGLYIGKAFVLVRATKCEMNEEAAPEKRASVTIEKLYLKNKFSIYIEYNCRFNVVKINH